jgi:hypothetical protein
MDGRSIKILFPVAAVTEVWRRILEQLFLIRLMGLVARTAHAALHGRMDNVFLKLLGAMTVSAYAVAQQQALRAARMGAVTASAHAAGHWHMHNALARKLSGVVTHEAQVGRVRRKTLGHTGGELVGNIGSIDTRMAGRTTHSHSGMD